MVIAVTSTYWPQIEEYLEANKAYQDKLVADQIKRQKETEQKEKEHQKKLDDIKSEYFGDNASERRAKYDDEIGALNEIYNSELQAAGNNAKEKLRIEEAYQKASKTTQLFIDMEMMALYSRSKIKPKDVKETIGRFLEKDNS